MRKLIAFPLMIMMLVAIVAAGTPRASKAQKGPPPVLENIVWVDYETKTDAPISFVKFKSGATHYIMSAFIDWSTADQMGARYLICEYWDEVNEGYVIMNYLAIVGPQAVELGNNTTGQNYEFVFNLPAESEFGQQLTVSEEVWFRTKMLDAESNTIVQDEKLVEVTWIP